MIKQFNFDSHEGSEFERISVKTKTKADTTGEHFNKHRNSIRSDQAPNWREFCSVSCVDCGEHETLILFDQQWRCYIVLLCFNVQPANNEELLFICLQHTEFGDVGRGCRREGQFILFESLETWDFGCDYASGFVGSRIVNILIWEKRSHDRLHTKTAFFWWNIFISFQRTSHSMIFWSWFCEGPPAVILDCLSCLVVTCGWCIRNSWLSDEIFWDSSRRVLKEIVFFFLPSPSVRWRWCIDDWCPKQCCYSILLKFHLKWIDSLLMRTLISF